MQWTKDTEAARIREQRGQFDMAQWLAAQRWKRSLPRIFDTVLEPDVTTLGSLRPSEPGIFFSDDGAVGKVAHSQDVHGVHSFGLVGVFVDVSANTNYLRGTLALRFDPAKLTEVARASLRLFRWNEALKRFDKISGSRPCQNLDFVFGRIAVPGHYIIVGLNANPVILATIGALGDLQPVLDAVPASLRDTIRDRICRVVLCAPDMLQALNAPKVLLDLYRSAPDHGLSLPSPILHSPSFGGNGQGPCQICSGVHVPLPELSIRDEPDPWASTCSAGSWESWGPTNSSGHIQQIALDPNVGGRIYAAAKNGGIWVLDSLSLYPLSRWRPLTDRLETLKMTAIAIAASNSDILYAASDSGTLYRSDSRGEHWVAAMTGLGAIRKILIDPTNANKLVLATSNGLAYTDDVSSRTPLSTFSPGMDIVDVASDPSDSDLLYVAIRNQGLLKGRVRAGTATFGSIFSWTDFVRLFGPSNPADASDSEIRVALGVRNADGRLQTDSNRVVVAKMSNKTFIHRAGGVGGVASWTLIGQTTNINQPGWNSVVAIDPFDPNIILAGQVDLHRTVSAGAEGLTWPVVAGAPDYVVHEDQHCLIFDGRTRGRCYLANDGGVFAASDSGRVFGTPRGTLSYQEWVDREAAARRNLNLGLVTKEFYRVGVQRSGAVGDAYHTGLIGSTRLADGKWELLEGGTWEFSDVYADPKRLSRYYVCPGSGGLARLRYPRTGTDDFLYFSSFSPFSSGQFAVSPIAVDYRRDSQAILCCANTGGTPSATTFRLMLTLEGDREPFSDPSVPGGVSGQPAWTVSYDNGPIDQLMCVRFSMATPGKAFLMSAAGKLLVKNEVLDGSPWQPLPQWSQIGVRQFSLNPHSDDRLYAITGSAFGRYEQSAPGVGTWVTSVRPGGTLPPTELLTIAAHPTKPGVLYLGARDGVYWSPDEGGNWYPLDEGFPNVEVFQIFISASYPGYLYAVTYGRGLWRMRICM